MQDSSHHTQGSTGNPPSEKVDHGQPFSPRTDEEMAEVIRQIEDERAAVEAAIERGIETGADGAHLTRLERAAILSFVESHVPEDGELELEGVTAHEFAARRVTVEPLVRKMVVALFLEYGTNERAIADGILGRHLDQAIDQLTPYAKASPLLGFGGRALFEEAPDAL